jgi:arsenite oxidase large subunit
MCLRQRKVRLLQQQQKQGAVVCAWAATRKATRGRPMPYAFIEMNPQDMAELNVKAGDLVEVYNDNGSTQAVAYPTPTAKRKQTFMLFAYPTGVQGNVVSPGVNEFIIPNYKQTWGGIRKIADAPEGVHHLTFKSQEYSLG